MHLFIRRDLFERFISCMVFIPRERFSTQLREEIQRLLENAYQGTVTAFYTQMTDSPLARAHIIIQTEPGNIPVVDEQELTKQIARVTYRWQDMLRQALVEKYGSDAESFYHAYADAFSQAYINFYDAQNAVHDIGRIARALLEDRLGLDLYQPKTDAEALHLKIYNPRGQATLSDILPMLENFGFHVIDENPFSVKPKGSGEIWIRDFRLRSKSGRPVDLESLTPRFEEALSASGMARRKMTATTPWCWKPN